MAVKIEMPGEAGAKWLGIGLVGLLVVALIGTVATHLWRSGKRSVNFDNVTAKLETTEQSAGISEEASDNAGQIIGGMNHVAIEDRRAVAAARAPGATAADRERVRQRALEAHAEGQDAACRLQRADCGPSAPGAAGE